MQIVVRRKPSVVFDFCGNTGLPVMANVVESRNEAKEVLAQLLPLHQHGRGAAIVDGKGTQVRLVP